MSSNSPIASSSNIMSSEAPFLPHHPSPSRASPWGGPSSVNSQSSGLEYYGLPPSPHSDNATLVGSPLSSVKVLRSAQLTPDSLCGSEQQQLCLPTHQVFDLPDNCNDSSPSPSSSPSPGPLEASTRPEKRSLSPTPGATRRKSTGERVTTKDFVPPDVSGLTKREARLVKNRAAAFLSRQRKREEFEAMEVRVKELETENAKLAAMSQQGGISTEVEKLRAQLAEAEKREQALRSTLARQPSVKSESVDKPMASSSREASASLRNGHRLGFVPVLSGALTSYLGGDSWPQVPQFEIEPEVLDVFAALEVSHAPSNDGRGRVRIHRPLAVPVKSESRSPSSMNAWPASSMNNFGSPFPNQMMAAHSLPTASELDRLGPFMGMGIAQQRFDVDVSSTPSFFEHPGSMGQHQLAEASFDYDPRFYNQYTPRMCKA